MTTVSMMMRVSASHARSPARSATPAIDEAASGLLFIGQWNVCAWKEGLTTSG